MRILGHGSYASAILVKNIEDSQNYVLKQTNLEQKTKKDIEQIQNEYVLIKQLDHPNIIKIYDQFIIDQNHYSILEYANNQDLEKYIQTVQSKQQRLSDEQIWKIFLQIALAVYKAHKHNIMHRDLKPANILLNIDKNNNLEIKLCDFGISKGDLFAQTQIGTPPYIAPEVWLGQTYNQSIDVWSLACILYELSELKLCFTEQTQIQMARKVIDVSYIPQLTNRPQLMNKIFNLMFNRDSEKRITLQQLFDDQEIKQLIKFFNLTHNLLLINNTKSQIKLSDEIPNEIMNLQKQLNLKQIRLCNQLRNKLIQKIGKDLFIQAYQQENMQNIQQQNTYLQVVLSLKQMENQINQM